MLSASGTHSLLRQDHPASGAAQPGWEQMEAKFSLLQIISWAGRGLPLSLSHVDTKEAASLCSSLLARGEPQPKGINPFCIVQDLSLLFQSLRTLVGSQATESRSWAGFTCMYFQD